MTTTPDPVTVADLAGALREAVEDKRYWAGDCDECYGDGEHWDIAQGRIVRCQECNGTGIRGDEAPRWQSLLDRYDAQVSTNPATDHVKAYDPDAWAKATHAAALHYYGPEYYEHDPAPLMEAVDAALYYLAPAIVKQAREQGTRHIAEDRP